VLFEESSRWMTMIEEAREAWLFCIYAPGGARIRVELRRVGCGPSSMSDSVEGLSAGGGRVAARRSGP
jgi:hypothetical protein